MLRIQGYLSILNKQEECILCSLFVSLNVEKKWCEIEWMKELWDKVNVKTENIGRSRSLSLL